ncbi:WXG100 family type VII secretion target [Micromonospora sp. NPDC004336]
MSQPMNVPIAQMLGAAATFQAQLEEMQRRLTVLENFMDERSRSWDGASKLAYADLRRQWQTGAQQLNQVGQQFAAAIGTSGRKFIDAETRNLEAISRTRRNFA